MQRAGKLQARKRAAAGSRIIGPQMVWFKDHIGTIEYPGARAAARPSGYNGSDRTIGAVEALGGFMKLLLAIVLGIVASFGLTILSELIWFSSATNKVWRLYPEFFGVAVIVGALVGLTARKQARVAAALSLTPWCVSLVVGANGGQTSSRWAIT